jgi:hypothetical protein
MNTRKFIAWTVLVAAVVQLSALDIRACGDKLLLLGAGVRVSRVHKAGQSRSILLYKSESLARAGSSDFEAAVKRVGHKVRIAKDIVQINEALKSATFDYLVAAPADLESVRGPIASSLSKPVLISMGVPAKAKEPNYVALISDAEKTRTK